MSHRFRTAVFIHYRRATNAVGYQTRSMTDQNGKVMESYSGGPVFKAMGSKGDTYTLNDFTTKGMDCSADCIQFLDPDTTETYLSATYADEETYASGWVGWWDAEDVGKTRLDGENADTYSSGTSFLSLYSSGNDISFSFSGEVEIGTKELVMTTQSPFICNPMPVDLTLKDIKASGMNCSDDCFQYLDPYTTETYLSVTYASKEAYGDSWIGWWDAEDVGVTRVDDTALSAGQGLLGLMTSGNEITLIFNSVLE